MSGFCVIILDRMFIPVALHLQLIRNALLLIRVPNLVHKELFVFNLVHGRGFCVSCAYEKR